MHLQQKILYVNQTREKADPNYSIDMFKYLA